MLKTNDAKRQQISYYLLAMLMTLSVLACSEDRETPQQPVGVSLAFNLSTARNVTRMSEEMTQQTEFRQIVDQKFFPFEIQGKIGLAEQSLGRYLTAIPENQNDNQTFYYYFEDRAVDIPLGTASFLCYAKATPNTDKYENGSIIATVAAVKPNTSDIEFSPEQIYTEKDASNHVKVDAKATAIATYLTAIANIIGTNSGENSDDFRYFVNEGRPLACSSANVQKLAAWATGKGYDLSSISETYANDYPGNIQLSDETVIHLPDGAAVVKWNSTIKAFEPQVETTSEANINSLDRYIYPAELYYYANSRIKTSENSLKTDYSGKNTWEEVLDLYEYDDGIMENSIHSVAIKDPLTYAVGCLRIGIVAGNSLTDAAGVTITLNDGTGGTEATFPLTAVFVSGQYAQNFDFTPKDGDERIIYDKTITPSMSMGAAQSTTPTTATPSTYTNTLVLQSKDATDVRFALEFENNSGQDFEGRNGTVFNGTKFYLVGTIEVPNGETDDYKKRVFTKGYTTVGTVRITSLEEAYTYLPDLLDPRLEVGIKLITNWIQSSTTNVPL